MNNCEIAKACFLAYANSDRAAVEDLIGEPFSFTSPLDNQIDRARYFDRCWPNNEHIQGFEFVRAIESGSDVVVTYVGTSTSGSKFRNTECLRVEDGKITSVEVYFGWDLPHPVDAGSSKDN